MVGATMSDDDMPMTMMPMYFTTALPTIVLFEGWNVTTTGQYVATWFAIAVMGLLRRLLVWSRLALVDAALRKPASGKRHSDDGEAYEEGAAGGDGGLLGGAAKSGGGGLTGWQATVAVALFGWPALRRSPVLLKLVDVLLFGCGHTLAFLNMLVVMTYNPGLMMAVVAGEMLGVLLVEPVGGGGASAVEDGADCH